jgi:hypothetical protein
MLQMHGACSMLGQTSAHRNTETCRQRVFEVQPLRSPDLNPFLGHLNA